MTKRELWADAEIATMGDRTDTVAEHFRRYIKELFAG